MSKSLQVQDGFNYKALERTKRDYLLDRTEKINALMQRTMEGIVEIGKLLIEVKQEIGHGHFEDWINQEFDWSISTAQNYMRVAEMIEEAMKLNKFKNATVAFLLPRKVLYLMASPSTPDEVRDQIWGVVNNGKKVNYQQAKALLTASKDEPDEPDDNDVIDAEFEEVASEPQKAMISLYSGNVELYTPAQYCESVRRVLGHIELDPASSEIANRNVKARRYFTAEQDGLKAHWICETLYLNCPYGFDEENQSNQEQWATQLVMEYKRGRIGAAIALFNARLSSSWFAQLHEFPYCALNHRIKFLNPDGTINKQPYSDSVFVYLGDQVWKFIAEFSQYGPIKGTLQLGKNGKSVYCDQVNDLPLGDLITAYESRFKQKE